jgi:polyphosphate kinase 2 (PPK2 family)
LDARYDEINTFEKELVEAGTAIVKVAMFVSLEEQKARLTERLRRPDKFWKCNPGDLDERKLWPAYQEAYQIMLERTSTDYAPWYLLPCDKKWYARMAVNELLNEALKALDLVVAAGRLRPRGGAGQGRRPLVEGPRPQIEAGPVHAGIGV